MNTINILYVDDEQSNLDAFDANFRRYFKVFLANSSFDAKAILDREEIHVLITDQAMPNEKGTQLLEHAFKNNPNQVRILITAIDTKETLQDAINSGHIFRYFHKPWDFNELYNAIMQAYQYYKIINKEKRIIEELEKTNEKLREIIKEQFNLFKS